MAGGFDQQQLAMISQIVAGALTEAGNEASQNLSKWKETQDEMIKQIGSFHSEAEAMKRMLQISNENVENMKQNLAQMQDRRDVVMSSPGSRQAAGF